MKGLKLSIKTGFRKLVGHTPIAFHKYLTKKKIQKMKAFLMTAEDERKCWQDEQSRDAIVAGYKHRFAKTAEKLEKQITEQFETNVELINLNKDAREIYRRQMEFAWFAYGFPPDEFMLFHLGSENREREKMRSFVSDLERWTFRFTANDFTQYLLADKADTFKRFSEYYGRDVEIIDSDGDFEKFSAFLDKHPEFVLKMVSSSRGNGVWLISGVPDRKAFFDKMRKNGKVMLEERIQQSDDMASFNDSSVNTLRISIYKTRYGLKPVHGIIRVGRKGAFIDNAAKGGISATVDVESGTVCSEGYAKDGMRYQVHPESGVEFKDFKLPEWVEAVDMCKAIAEKLESYKYVSFDLAHSDRGWVIVEINPSGGYHFQAGTLLGFRKQFQETVNSMDLLVPFAFRD